MSRAPVLPRRRLAAGVSSVAVLLAALDAYVVVTVMVDIMRDMGIPIEHPERATPIVTAYLLGYVAAMPLLGQLSDRVGRARVIQGCLLFFAVGSVVSAAAPGLSLLIAGRLIQGAAGGALLPVTFAVISDLWEPKQRPLPLGLVGAAQELGSVVGPLYGAALAALSGWRSVFWVNLPLAAVAMVAVQRGLPKQAGKSGLKVDLGGGLLLAFSLGALIVGLYNPDPEQAILPPWGPPVLLVAAAGLVGFVLWERRSPSRLLDMSSVDSGPFLACLGCSFFSGAALMATLVDVPLLARTLLGEDSLGGALILSRFLAALAVAAVVGGVLTRRAGERVVAAGASPGGRCLLFHLPLAPQHPGVRLRIGLPGGVPDGGGPGARRLWAGPDHRPVGLGRPAVLLPEQHGVVSASVVVARMMGMLVGIAALGAAGVYRFQQLTKDLAPPFPFEVSPQEFQKQLGAYEEAVRTALHTEYGELFAITSAVCLVGAALAMGLGGGSARES